MDTMKHVGDAFWSQFFASSSPASPARLWTVGEVFTGDVAQIAHYLDTVGSPSVFDFPLKFAITDSLARGGSVRRLADLFAHDTRYRDPTRLSTFLDNHDVWRFTSEAEAAGSAPAEATQRLGVVLTLLYLARGIPVIYYGTEIAMRGQGDSWDRPIGASSREDMDFTQFQSGHVAMSIRIQFQSLRLPVLVFLLCLAGARYGGDAEVTIKKTDRCPVCGMFVYKYPKWVARIVLQSGEAFFYDGAKDMFKHVFETAKYTPGHSAEKIQSIYVTDYYEVELIDAKTAFYVIGSDVLGPMGHELLPFKDQESAQEFLEDHQGKTILRFQDVTPAVIEALDRRS